MDTQCVLYLSNIFCDFAPRVHYVCIVTIIPHDAAICSRKLYEMRLLLYCVHRSFKVNFISCVRIMFHTRQEFQDTLGWIHTIPKNVQFYKNVFCMLFVEYCCYIYCWTILCGKKKISSDLLMKIFCIYFFVVKWMKKPRIIGLCILSR